MQTVVSSGHIASHGSGTGRNTCLGSRDFPSPGFFELADVSVLRPCKNFGCPNLVAWGLCQSCAGTAAEALSGSTTRRGYGADWERLRKLKLATDPVCEIRTHCHGDPATEVDHRVNFRGAGNESLRLDWANLQSTCGPCHRAKTTAERGLQPSPESLARRVA